MEKHLGGKGIKGIFYSTIVGAIVPVCCWGSLPIAVSFHKKGASLGPIFAILVTTPATSVNALFVAWRFMGLKFTLYIFIAVILMGIIMGLIGNSLRLTPKPERNNKNAEKPHHNKYSCQLCGKKTPWQRIRSVIKYACIDMPKEIGVELMAGLALAALVSAFTPIGVFVRNYLVKGYAYLFALVFGLIVYMCATMSIPLVYAFVKQGMNAGAGLSLLIIGPIASFGTMLVLRKEFGFKTLIVFVVSISTLSSLAGYLFTLL